MTVDSSVHCVHIAIELSIAVLCTFKCYMLVRCMIACVMRTLYTIALTNLLRVGSVAGILALRHAGAALSSCNTPTWASQCSAAGCQL
jgi:hypothetical protein